MTTTHTLRVPGARLYYEVRGSGPVLLLIGAPMESYPFAPLADRLADEYTVVTTDPRGISHSPLDDPTQDSTPELRADDARRVLAALGDEPASVLGTSGGAITALELVAHHPERVRTLVAHEPPLIELLPDRAELRVAIDDVYDTHRRGDTDAAWGKFFALSGFEIPGDGEAPPLSDPSLPPEVAQANGDYMLAHMLRPTTRHRPDIDALRAAGTRIVVGIGTASRGQLCHRTSTALAARLDAPVADLPGDHMGFVTDPDAFATALRGVLAEDYAANSGDGS
ncbi:alpha/beta fold hydrolase [Pseudonocardia acaciae]|uniref:alpha/beta fold hydrolase n=1 Tax=Pseudonocardia acaciae TaxID=551276 RepID=UPI0004918891|nr:alpha/beta hydrolase [Pseudonocardia acaciae]